MLRIDYRRSNKGELCKMIIKFSEQKYLEWFKRTHENDADLTLWQDGLDGRIVENGKVDEYIILDKWTTCSASNLEIEALNMANYLREMLPQLPKNIFIDDGDCEQSLSIILQGFCDRVAEAEKEVASSGV
jgi:hypothetical protein